MKRKASELEESPFTRGWAFNDSSVASTASPESIKASQNLWGTPVVPYLNTRTRKRVRDGRPDEETIHQSTLAKLFQGQKQIHTQELQEQRRSQQVSSYLMSLDIPRHDLAQDQEPKQRNIDAFFGGSSQSKQPKLQTSYVFTIPSTDSSNILTCEDCNTALQAEVDMDAMDVDIAGGDWSCAHCSKRVCDMCAVRGDLRVCLECAVPGGGSR